MKQFSKKIIFVLGLSLLFTSMGINAFAADKDYPIVYSVIKTPINTTTTQPPVKAEK